MPVSYPHLAEVAEILAGGIGRIEVAKAEENENVEPEIEIPLDISPDSSVTVDRPMRPE